MALVVFGNFDIVIASWGPSLTSPRRFDEQAPLDPPYPSTKPSIADFNDELELGVDGLSDDASLWHAPPGSDCSAHARYEVG